MNNSKLVIENVPLTLEEPERDITHFKERESELIIIIEAIREIEKSSAWSTLKTKLFETLVISLERDLTSEAKKDAPDTLKLARISGQLKWAEKYADLSKLENSYRLELTNIRRKLYGTS